MIKKVLRDLLGKYFSDVSKFNLNFLRNSIDSDIKISFAYLSDLGFDQKTIAKNARLLRLKKEAIQFNYDNLKSLGVAPNKISTNASLLAMNPETIKKNYHNLISLGIGPQKIGF